MDALVRAEVAFDHLDVVEELGEVLAAAGREVVEHAHGVAAGEQRADEIRADEAGAARDENLATAHASGSPRSIVWQGAATGQCYCTADREPEQRRRRNAGDEPERGQLGGADEDRDGERRARADRVGAARGSPRQAERRRTRRADRRQEQHESPTIPMSALACTYAFWTPQRLASRRERCRRRPRGTAGGRRRGAARSSSGSSDACHPTPVQRMGEEDLPADVGEHRRVGSTSRRSCSWCSPAPIRGSRCSWPTSPPAGVSEPAASITRSSAADGERPARARACASTTM